MVQYYGAIQLIELINHFKIKSLSELIKNIPSKLSRNEWTNIGGQLIPSKDVEAMKLSIKKGKIDSWDSIHDFYVFEGIEYHRKKMLHGLASLQEISGMKLQSITSVQLKDILLEAIAGKKWLVDNILKSREKDYTNPFRNMVYANDAERDAVLGKLEDNTFIQEQEAELETFTASIHALIKKMKLK